MLAVLKLAVLVAGVLALAKLGFLNFIIGRFDTGCFGVRPKNVCIHVLVINVCVLLYPICSCIGAVPLFNNFNSRNKKNK
jgi:hypothetical protein